MVSTEEWHQCYTPNFEIDNLEAACDQTARFYDMHKLQKKKRLKMYSDLQKVLSKVVKYKDQERKREKIFVSLANKIDSIFLELDEMAKQEQLLLLGVVNKLDEWARDDVDVLPDVASDASTEKIEVSQ